MGCSKTGGQQRGVGWEGIRTTSALCLRTVAYSSSEPPKGPKSLMVAVVASRPVIEGETRNLGSEEVSLWDGDGWRSAAVKPASGMRGWLQVSSAREMRECLLGT